jgi:hypothetical protein
MWGHAQFTRDIDHAKRIVANATARRGETDNWGRITDTLLGAEMTEMELGGRPIYRVTFQVHNHDPLVDGNLPRDVREACQAYAAAHSR